MRGSSAAAFVCASALVLLIAGCGSPTQSPSPTAVGHTGGTLRIGLIGDDVFFREATFPDPSRITPPILTRCCLTRTPLMYPGAPTADGGTRLLPDLVEQMPEVARDGLSWTLRIQPGIKYSPPNDSIEVTSADFVTAVERSIRLNNEVFPTYSFVAGAQEYLEGQAAGVSGLETPDSHTLVIRLVEPYGAFDYLADPSWAPIPAQLAAGHDDDLGLVWPSTGPYAYVSQPADPAAARATYVRNLSWSSERDSNREALVDRIEIMRLGDDVDAALAKLDASEVDFVSTRLDATAAQRYRSDPSTTLRVRSSPSEYLYRLPMNIAVPPFDDVAVRRAVSFAVDRVAARDAIVSALTANGTTRPPTVLSQHVFSDSVTGGLLLGYDPYAVGDGRGNISRARTEMAKSRYDSDGDGLCDADVCAAISLPTFDLNSGAVVARSFEAIGIHVQPVVLDEHNETTFNSMSFGPNRAALAIFPFGWGFDLSGNELTVLVQGGPNPAPDGFTANTSLVGATPEDLDRWGYSVTSVPSVDDLIDRCKRELGNRRVSCWAELDQVVAESIVPWVPLFAFESVWVGSPRVSDYTLDQAAHQQFPALDRVSLVSGTE